MSAEPRRAVVVAAAVLTTWIFPARAEPTEAQWEAVRKDDGITLSIRHAPEHKTATFRARGEVIGSLWHVLAIVMDDGRAKEWARVADESKVLRALDARNQIVYARSRQPWPVNDRDLVMRRTLEVIAPGREMRVRMTCIDGERPVLPKVVRVRDCENVFHLRKVDDERTLVEFQIRADAGGGPEWLVKRIAQNIPLDTIVGLRAQVQKTRSGYSKQAAALRGTLEAI